MATSKETAEEIASRLAPAGDVSLRSMFGEYAVYLDGKVVGFICDDTLFIKQLPATAELASSLEPGKPYPGAKDYWVVDDDRLSDTEWTTTLLQRTAAVVPARTPKK